MKRGPVLPSFDYQPINYGGPPADEVLQLRREFLNPGIFLYCKKTLMVVEGKMQYVWDEHGRRYLDAIGGIVTLSVGHCHSDVVEVARRQKRNTAAFHQNLSTSEHCRICAKTSRENAGRAENLLFRELRLGSE
jgi:acetylornithine/succinyldiaminopimelate/putrescine aminotransferase